MRSNKTNGNAFERDFCRLLAENGFWAHNMAQSQSGQPADVIAVRNGYAHLIDCKVVSNDAFALNRMEDNQIAAMRIWMDKGNTVPQFAIRLPSGEIRMASFPVLYTMRRDGITRIKNEIIREMFPDIKEWIANCE